ncbi:MAG: binding-protein-dependent transport system inner rane component [Anaerocolumna sp.]|jgi:putative aldouronate transport system permease protein|nr:binding-protein-dependent transport system inner rane component [Anaerocolumna sp.]
MQSKGMFIRQSKLSYAFDILNTVIMVLFAFVMLYPFWNQLVISLNEGADTVKGGVYFWPRVWTFDNYVYVFGRSHIFRGAVISVLRVVVGTITCLFCTGLLAYITTIRNFPGRRFMRIVFIITMYFGGGLIPTYLLFSQLGLMETFTVYWLPGLFGAYYMMLIASYMQGLPEGLTESARIDGASEMRIYFSIMIPLCRPVLAAVSVMLIVNHWNSWFDVMLYNSSGNWDTLQVYLRKILLEAEQASKLLSDQKKFEAMKNLTTTSIRAATTMIVSIPVICIYPFFQKYFVGGITIGAVKE